MTFTEFGRPGQLVERPWGHAVYVAPGELIHAAATLHLGDLHRCALASGPGGEGWRIVASGKAHRHTTPVERDGVIVGEQELPTDCRCGGLDNTTYRTPEAAALALMNAWHEESNE